MKIQLKRTTSINRPIKIYGTVQRDSESRVHRVVYIRSKNFRGWLCDCENFFFDAFSKGRNCEHLQAVRAEVGRYGTKVKG